MARAFLQFGPRAARWRFLTPLAVFSLCLGPLAALDAGAQPEPIGLWEFDDPDDLTRATIGLDLVLHGNHTPVEGCAPEDCAARIEPGSYYACEHGIAPNGGGLRVNLYTIVMDVRTFGRGLWHALFQANPWNAGPAEISSDPPGALGSDSTGYAFPRLLDARTWYRVAIVIENGIRCDVYADTFAVLHGEPQPIDGLYALHDQVLFFADGQGGDGEIDVSRIAIYDRALTPPEVAALGGLGGMQHFMTPAFLQNVKPDGISILWETEELEACVLDYGADSTYGSGVVPTVIESGFGTHIYTAVLTDLEPATTYHYRVVGEQETTADCTFETAPAEPIDFSFAVWGDSQGYNRGDYDRDPTEPTRAIFEHMRAQPVAFGVGCGDFAEIGADYVHTHLFHLDRAVAIMGTQRPLYFAWGNHDVWTHAVIRKFADLPSKDRGDPYYGGYGSYSFDYAGCHFICIDFLCETTDIPDWVREDLETPEAQNARFTFVFIHRAPYQERWYAGNEQIERDLVPLLESYGVDACFCGHLHEYERGYQNAVFYCTVGNAACLGHHYDLVCDWDHMRAGGFHHLAADIEGGLIRGYVIVDVVGDLMTARLHTFEADGTYREILDSFWKSSGPAEVWGPPASDRNTVRGVASAIHLACPNPYCSRAEIRWHLPGCTGEVRPVLHILSEEGRLLRTLEALPRGQAHGVFTWDGRDARGRRLNSAVYHARIEAGRQTASARLVVLR